MRFSGALVGAFLLVTLISCGGAPSESQRAGDSQMALAASVVAAPTQAKVATAAPTSAPRASPTEAPPTQAPTEAATLTPTAAPAEAPPTQAPTEAATLTPTAAPAEAPPTQAPPAAAPTQPPPAFACDSPCSISFAELYAGATVAGPILSDKAKAISGTQVIMRGFMAPPLSPSTTFFVLTKDPMVYCPFCNTAADWPFDIVYIKMAGGGAIPTMVPTTNIAVIGRFEVGSWADPDTGFVSLIRIFADSVQPIS